MFSIITSNSIGNNEIFETNERHMYHHDDSKDSLFFDTLILQEKSSGLQIPAKEGGNTEYELADMNNDGYLDIISVGDHDSPYINSDQHGIMVWFGDGGNYWNVNQSGYFGYGGCAIGDLNLDGNNDVAWGVHHNYASDDFGDTLIDAALGDGTGRNWTPWGEGLASNGESWGMFATDLADFDIDGDLDIISLSFGCCNGVHIYENHGNGTWSQPWAYTGGNVHMETIETCDFNNDGYSDFICSNQDVNSFFGNGCFNFTNADTGLPIGSIYGIDVGDMNNDGSDDLVAALYGMGVRCYIYNVQNNRWESESSGLPTYNNFYLVQFGDLNNDGNLDIIAYTDPTGIIYLGDGNGNWTEDISWNMQSPGYSSAMRVDGDVDFDGREDILIQASEGSWPNDVNTLKLFSPWQEPSQLNAQIKIPHGGEVFRVGSVRNIRWLSAVPVSQGQAMVDIKLSRNGESGPWATIASNVPNNGCYQWIVAGAGSNNCRIKIILDTGSDNNYTISKSDFTMLNGIQQYSIINLKSNWNFISVPFNNSINLSNITVNYNNTKYNWSEAINLNIINNYLFSWNRLGQVYTFSDTLVPGYGYWMYAYEDCELWIENITLIYDNYITDVEQNWNIISVPYDQNVSKTDILVNDIPWDDAVTAGIINDYLFGWDRDWQGYNFADTIMPGYAYWVYAYQQCTLKRNES